MILNKIQNLLYEVDNITQKIGRFSPLQVKKLQVVTDKNAKTTTKRLETPEEPDHEIPYDKIES
jgi:hypothetical protein